MNSATDIIARTAQNSTEREAAFAVRHTVFLDEQGVLPEEEWDAFDATATHFIAIAGSEVVGAARLRLIEGGSTGKIERLAVLQPYRGKSVGAALMQAMLDWLQARNIAKSVLEAQTYAIPFYERFGFVAEGEVYMDARIEHRKMVWST